MSLAAAALIALAVLIGFAGLVVAVQVDDWRRDLTTNVAETRADAADPLLRSVTVDLAAADAARLVRSAAEALPRWRLRRERPEIGALRLEFVRTSRLFRFEDDVTVWIEDQGTTRTIRARSASRRGRGDLGQNPRNLRALVQAVRHRLH